MKQGKIKNIIMLVGGAMIVAFALSNIHSRYKIAEGGQLGIELLFYKWFSLSPAISSLIIDFTMFFVSFLVLGKKYFRNAIVGTLSYSLFYFLFQNSPYLLPNLSNNLMFASIIGGLLVGVGCGLVVKSSGACGGDDILALILSKTAKLNISISYFVLDIIVILLSLSYLRGINIFYSVLTAIISSVIIGVIYNKK